MVDLTFIRLRTLGVLLFHVGVVRHESFQDVEDSWLFPLLAMTSGVALLVKVASDGSRRPTHLPLTVDNLEDGKFSGVLLKLSVEVAKAVCRRRCFLKGLT